MNTTDEDIFKIDMPEFIPVSYKDIKKCAELIYSNPIFAELEKYLTEEAFENYDKDDGVDILGKFVSSLFNDTEYKMTPKGKDIYIDHQLNVSTNHPDKKQFIEVTFDRKLLNNPKKINKDNVKIRKYYSYIHGSKVITITRHEIDIILTEWDEDTQKFGSGRYQSSKVDILSTEFDYGEIQSVHGILTFAVGLAMDGFDIKDNSFVECLEQNIDMMIDNHILDIDPTEQPNDRFTRENSYRRF